jgi:hypothetical protein
MSAFNKPGTEMCLKAPWESPHDAFVAGHSGNYRSPAFAAVCTDPFEVVP